MRTQLSSELLASSHGRRADAILRTCVHCGMCNAQCPTYRLLGDELDGPRGRIYLIKGMLEAPGATDAELGTVRTHLDRCLTCGGCEVACPSGVQYGELLEIGRGLVETRTASRAPLDAMLRRLLGWMLPRPGLFAYWVRVGTLFRWMLPAALAQLLPTRAALRRGEEQPIPHTTAPSTPKKNPPSRRALLLRGCVQRLLTPAANAAAARLLEANGVAPFWAAEEQCCGGLNLHLGQTERALRIMRHTIDALRPLLDEVDLIVSTASGCGVTVKDYGRLLADDPDYADTAAQISAKTRDLAEVAASFTNLASPNVAGKVAWHAPCTLRHGQRVAGTVEGLLTRVGLDLVDVADAHICCGSAGIYSLLQRRLAGKLRDNKLANLMTGGPDIIATANIGCQMHLAATASVPVVHWAELVAPPPTTSGGEV